MTSDEDQHARPTTASIDRRVERLELAQAETTRKVDALGVSMDFLKELMGLKFAGLESALASQNSKLDVFIAKIDGLIEKGQEQAVDLDASPLGRAIGRRLSSLEASREAHDDVLGAMGGFGAGIRQYVVPIISVSVAAAALVVALRGGI
jgi:hypothetical protein